MLASELDAPNQPAGEAAVRPLTVGAPPRKLIRRRPTAGRPSGPRRLSKPSAVRRANWLRL